MDKVCLAVVVVGLIGVGSSYPATEESPKPVETVHNRQITARQGAFGGILAALGTALVPVVSAALGPILTNLANGIAMAFNDGRNPSRNRTSPDDEAQALLIRIPTDSPLYAALIQGKVIMPDQDDLPAVGPTALPVGKTPHVQPGKFSGFSPKSPAPVEDVEPILTHDADVPEPPAAVVKRVPQRKRPIEADF